MYSFIPSAKFIPHPFSHTYCNRLPVRETGTIIFKIKIKLEIAPAFEKIIVYISKIHFKKLSALCITYAKIVWYVGILTVLTNL